VLVDTEGGNNLLYLPLDQLVQRRQSAPAFEPSSSPPMSVPPSPTSGVVRSRERETR
jgi:hypothetical protein